MTPDTETGWLICPDCESRCRDHELQPGEALRCRRCGFRLRQYRSPHALQTLWALATAGLILAVLANTEPVLTFDVAGNAQSNHILSGVRGLIAQDYAPVAALVFFGAIAGPFLHLGSVWYVASACCAGRRWPGVFRALALIGKFEPWNLMPVYAVAAMVAVVRLDLLGEVRWQQGALWILLVSLCSQVVSQIFDRVDAAKRLAGLA
jgi:paraquat-inducible protein A